MKERGFVLNSIFDELEEMLKDAYKEGYDEGYAKATREAEDYIAEEKDNRYRGWLCD